MNKEIEKLLNKMKKCNGWLDYYLECGEVDLLLSYIEQLEKDKDKAIEFLEKSKLNQLDTHCKYLYIDFDAEKIENIDELLNILKGDSVE